MREAPSSTEGVLGAADPLLEIVHQNGELTGFLVPSPPAAALDLSFRTTAAVTPGVPCGELPPPGGPVPSQVASGTAPPWHSPCGAAVGLLSPEQERGCR